jgi:hypothetical protein
LLSRWLLLKVLDVKFEDSQSRWRLTIAIGNKQLQQINKQYTKQYLNS